MYIFFHLASFHNFHVAIQFTYLLSVVISFFIKKLHMSMMRIFEKHKRNYKYENIMYLPESGTI